MKLFIDSQKKLHFGALGITSGEEFLTGQSEKLVIQFTGDVAADTGSVQVALKASATATVLLAECTSFTEAAGLFTGWLDLNTDEAIGAAGSSVYIEVSWQDDGHDQCNDYATVALKSRIVTGGETSPAASLTWFQRVVAVFGSWFTADDALETLTPVIASQAEAEAGTISTKFMTPLRVAQAIDALGGGDPPTYASGFLTFTAANGSQYTVAAFPVA